MVRGGGGEGSSREERSHGGFDVSLHRTVCNLGRENECVCVCVCGKDSKGGRGRSNEIAVDLRTNGKQQDKTRYDRVSDKTQREREREEKGCQPIYPPAHHLSLALASRAPPPSSPRAESTALAANLPYLPIYRTIANPWVV